MRHDERLPADDPVPFGRRRLVRAARRVLWDRLRGLLRTRPLERSRIRRRLAEFLARCGAARLAAILRSAALRGAVAAALIAPGAVRAQDFPPIDLADVARGEGGFVVRAEGQSASRAGVSVADAGDVNGDGIPDLIVGGSHCHYSCSTSPAYVIFGSRSGAAVELADVHAGRGGFAIVGIAVSHRSGAKVSGAGDVNGDGLDDVVVGTPGASPGKCHVVFGKADGAPVQLSEVEAGRGGFAIRAAATPDSVGYSLSGAGDVNGDGLADVMVGAPEAAPAGRNRAGESYVVFGKPDGAPVELSEVQAGRGGFAIRGAAAVDRAGMSVSDVGDVNGDGLADVIVGSPAGKSHVVFGKPGGAAVELSEVQAGRGGFAIEETPPRYSGTPVSGAGDVNGDGLADVIVGAPAEYRHGQPLGGNSYVVFGKSDGTTVDLSTVLSGQGGFAILGAEPYAGYVMSISGAGDVNGDGLDDLVIGAIRASPGGRTRAGESYVVFGKAAGAAVELSEVQAGRGGFSIRGIGRFDLSGRSVSGAGDLNGDGLDEVLIGAPFAPYGTRGAAGESYVVFGKPGGAAVELAEVREGRGGFPIRGVKGDDRKTSRVALAGDVNGDGIDDVVMASAGASPGRTYRAGETYVIFGKPDRAAVEHTSIQGGQGGFAIRGSASRDFTLPPVPALNGAVSVSGAGDVNGDGLSDILIGAYWASPAGRNRAGESYVVFGKPGGAVVELSDVQAGGGGFAVRGAEAGDKSGLVLSGAGDVNGDGLDDVIIGSLDASPPGRNQAGKGYVVFGTPAGAAVELSEVQAGLGGFAIHGAAVRDYAGSVSGAGDVNGDGLADVLVAARGASPAGRNQAGESYVIYGKQDGALVELSDVQAGRGGFAIRGAARGNHTGSVAAAGDVNGDGLADVLVGAQFASPGGKNLAGESYVVFGKQDGAAVDLMTVQSGRGFAIRGSVELGLAGTVAGGGDVNGDGLADVLVGAPGAADYAGETFLVFGKADGAAVELSRVASGRGGFAIRGIARGIDNGDRSGASVAGAGDIDGDGLADDLVIASGLADARYPSYPSISGASYVVFGPRVGSGATRFRRGAVLGEETLGLTDAIVLLGHLFLGEAAPPCLDAADTDDSGVLDLSDAIVLLRHLFLGGEAPPDPGPVSCGRDPTEDDLGCASPPGSCGA